MCSPPAGAGTSSRGKTSWYCTRPSRSLERGLNGSMQANIRCVGRKSVRRDSSVPRRIPSTGPHGSEGTRMKGKDGRKKAYSGRRRHRRRIPTRAIGRIFGGMDKSESCMLMIRTKRDAPSRVPRKARVSIIASTHPRTWSLPGSQQG
jgi:hypothetical protein